MNLNLSTFGILLTGIYLLLVGGINLFEWNVNATFLGIVAFVGGICLILGIFVTNSFSTNRPN